MRRLILARVRGLSRIHFRTGEGVQLPGWDGTVEADAADTFVPLGASGWELSTEQRPGTKAEDDYQKRTSDPLGLRQDDTAFVFATPRSWADKEQWVMEKREAGVWKEVRAYDVDDLEAWLETVPAVHVWYSELIGKSPEGLRSIDAFWTNWADATAPSLTEALVIGGRESSVAEVQSWLVGNESAVTVKADSHEEAMAFAVAAFRILPTTDYEHLLASAVIVERDDAWDRIVESQQGLVLFTTVDSVDVARAIRRGHRVVVAASRSDVATGAVAELPRLRRRAIEENLLELGLTDTRASELATVGRRSLLTLRRRLAISPALQRPSWASLEEGRALLAPMLAGSWEESSEGDKEALSALAGDPYEQVSAQVARWASVPDPPVRRISSTWFITSKEDSWDLLRPLLTSDDLARFGDVVLEVLGATHPSMELPLDQRWMAGAVGYSSRWSARLSEGLADTLALIAARAGPVDLPGGVTGDSLVGRVVRRLLEAANDDESGHLWASLTWVLPLLAEATPEVFLGAAEDGVAGDAPVLIRLFTDSDEGSILTSSSAHTGLLWALENLAWSKDHLARSCLVLARLARLDPGGRLSNRPANSLREVLLPWHPQTTASSAGRLEVIDALRRSESGVAWTLMIALLPESHGIASPTHHPRWREWKPESLQIDRIEWRDFVAAVVDRLLVDVRIAGDRWSMVIERLDTVPPDSHDAIVARLAELGSADIPAADLDQVLMAIRHLVSRHRRYASAKWAMPSERVDRLEEIYTELTGGEVRVAQLVGLFSHDPDLMEAEDSDWRTYQVAVEAARREAVFSILDEAGLTGVIALAQDANLPGEVGRSLAGVGLTSDQERQLLGELMSSDQQRQLLAQGYAVARARDAGFAWAQTVIDGQLRDWSAEHQARFMLCLPSTPATWALVRELGEATEGEYWSRFRPIALDDPSGCEEAVGGLLVHGRPFVALDLLGLYIDRRDEPLDAQQVIAALGQAAVSSPDPNGLGSMLSYHVARLFEFLDGDENIDESEIARLEFAYLPILEHSDRPPRLLHGRLAQEPDFFVEAVSLVYKGEGEPNREVSEEERTRAHLVRRLLDGWREPPGMTNDGEIDEDRLRAWVLEAREKLAELNRVSIGDEMIGKALRHFKPADDGVWPPGSVRDLIEEISSHHLETGIEIEVFNTRGVTSRALDEGGIQERSLSAHFRNLADDSRNRWPRTSAMLRRIAESYADQARREDEEAELREDFWR